MAFRRFTNSWHWHSDIPTFLTCRKVRRRTVSRIKLKDIQQKQSKETKDTPSVPGMPLLKGSKIVTKRSTHQQSYTVIHWISMNIPAYSLTYSTTWHQPDIVAWQGRAASCQKIPTVPRPDLLLTLCFQRGLIQLLQLCAVSPADRWLPLYLHIADSVNM